MASFSSHGHGSGSPCGACKFLRRKCTVDCIFAPYFHCEQEPSRFAAIHKVFGASNTSKLLLHVPPSDRYEAVCTIAYEAQARMQDPVYGCVSRIFALQQQVVYLQAQLMQMRAQVAQRVSEAQHMAINSRTTNTNIANNNDTTSGAPYSYPTCSLNLMASVSPSSSSNPADSRDDVSINNMPSVPREEELSPYDRARTLTDIDMGDLQELAFRLMKD